MNDINEARGRIALAEMEQRRQKEKSIKRFARWRFSFSLARSVVMLSVGIYVATHFELSTAQLVYFFLFYVIFSSWENSRTAEEVTVLKKEIEQLKNEVKRKSA